MQPIFEFINVTFKNILDLPTMIIEKEKITTLVGPSGSGKTTILRLLNKMLSPTSGKILFNGADLSKINAITHRCRVTMLSQSPSMFEGSIKDNLIIGLQFQGKTIPDDKALKGMLDLVNLKKPLEESAQTLSGGEKQRLALGRVLLLDSDVYLLDEPSSALDDITEEIIIAMVTKHIRDKRKTLVMVTHSNSMAEKYSNNIIALANGSCSLRRL